MANAEINIQIDEKYEKIINLSLIERTVYLALNAAGVEYNVELGLVITDDRTVQTLNKQYRGVDRTTDVLSFALTEQTLGNRGRFVAPPDKIIHLGEVVISLPQAERQAEDEGHTVQSEVVLLITHGVLHLLGYDHDNIEKAKKMRTIEIEVMKEMAKDI